MEFFQQLNTKFALFSKLLICLQSKSNGGNNTQFLNDASVRNSSIYFSIAEKNAERMVCTFVDFSEEVQENYLILDSCVKVLLQLK